MQTRLFLLELFTLIFIAGILTRLGDAEYIGKGLKLKEARRGRVLHSDYQKLRERPDVPLFQILRSHLLYKGKSRGEMNCGYATPVKTKPREVIQQGFVPGSRFKEMGEILGLEYPSPGGGAAWADYDLDADLDLFITGWTDCEKNTLYKNNGDATFTDISDQAGIPRILPSEGVNFIDYNNDGYPDLYLVRGFSGYPEGVGKANVLLENNGDGTFTDVTESSGLGNTGIGRGAAWADYDNDGFLDVYVANHGTPKSKVYVSELNALYRNNGDGTFTDVTKEAGVADVAVVEKHGGTPRERSGLSLQPFWFDYNGDGWQDLYIATDNSVSPLYKNNGDGTFTDVTAQAGVNLRGTGMGVAVGDYDNDGDLDLYLTNDGPNFLFQNQGDGTFKEVALSAKVANTGTGWATGFLDYDNDGDLDLYVVNGAVAYKFYESEASRKLNNRDVFYENNGDGTFSKVTELVGVFDEEHNMAGAHADYNNDGFLDIIAVGSTFDRSFAGGLNLFYKNLGNANNWITIRLVGKDSNRDGIGARVGLKAGGKTQIQEVSAGNSYNSQNSLWLTFGLGKAPIVDKIEVSWPSGKRQVLFAQPVNQKITIEEE